MLAVKTGEEDALRRQARADHVVAAWEGCQGSRTHEHKRRSRSRTCMCLPVCVCRCVCGRGGAVGGSNGPNKDETSPPTTPPLGRGARIKTSCRVSSSRAASSPATSGRCVSPHSPGGLSPPEASLQRLASPGKGDDPARTDRWPRGHALAQKACLRLQVLEVVAAVRGDDRETLARQVFENTRRVFFQAASPRI